ncbi:DUF3820 family protein [candidate division WOR-3 bacterium]|nr:DUF3820 family protein [candidate division WOR-3 bacterium]
MFKLRLYQKEAVEVSVDFFNDKTKKNSIILLPTGSGKSLVIAGIVKKLNGKVLILQPTKEILEQNIAKFRIFGGQATIYSASFNQKNLSQVTYATIGSIIRKKHLFEGFKYIIIDECHFVNAKGGMYEELLNYLNLKTLGLTATPYRLVTDGYGGSILKFLTRTRPRIFKDVIYYVQNKTLFDQNYLVPLEYIDIEGFDVSQIKVNSTGADFDDESLKRYFKIIDHADRTVAVVKDLNDMQRNGIIVFNKFVDEALYVKNQINGAEILTATTNKKERTETIKALRASEITTVCNVGILGIGFDYPELDTIVLARPTMSLALYYQWIGRGVRIHPDKEKTLVVDLCGNHNKFGKVEDLEFHENNGLYFISDGKTQLTNVYYGDEKPVNTIFTMPFGKHKGKLISKIPKDYIIWLNENVKLHGKLKQKVGSRLK